MEAEAGTRRSQHLSAGQKQHVQLFRKLRMRRRLVEEAIDGAAYVPYIGEGDIAAELYSERQVYGVDLQEKFLGVAKRRLNGRFVNGDCRDWHFSPEDGPFAIADFDSYGNPYESFASFWENASKARRVVMFFCDGRRMRIQRSKTEALLPAGERKDVPTKVWRRQVSMWHRRYVLPWVEEVIAPYEIVQKVAFYRYLTLHWGCVVEAE